MSETKLKKNRSVAYPVISLENAISSMEAIKSNLGKDKYNRKLMVEALGHNKNSGHGARKVAALVHYGLVKREGNVYSYDNITERILLPKSQEEKEQALIEAVNNPKLFKSLIERYNEQSLPDLFSSILSRDYHINENVKEKATDIFIKSIEYAGLYKNGVVANKKNDVSFGEESDKIESGVKKQNNDLGKNKFISQKHNTKAEMLSLELPCGIVIYYPKELSYKFAMGEFSEKIKALNDEIKKPNKENQSE